MRIEILTGAAVLCLGLFGANSAMAAGPNIALSLGTGSWGATTCGDFTKLDPTAQASLITQVGEQDPSLTSNSGASDTTQSTTNMTAIKQPNPLTAGKLVSACEAATPSTTLEDAFSAASPTDAPSP